MPFSQPDLAALAAILKNAASTEIMPRFRKLPPGAIRTKSGPLDLVTDADEAAEAAITRALERDFPGCLVVGEEASSADPSLIARLAASPFAITLDPIDGTANYAAGLPLFGVMAAVVEHGRTIAAIILDPVVGSFSAALAGMGAHECAADGSVAALHVAPPAPVGAMKGMISWRFMPPGRQLRVLEALPRFATVWDHRCAAHEYRALVAGHSDFVVFNRLMPWDHLPGVLLHREAGGHSGRFDGSPYVAGMGDGGLICAPNSSCWNAVATTILSERCAA